MTNVKAWELNYDKYSKSRYDRDIVNVIPGHKELHKKLVSFSSKKIKKKDPLIIELGIGTGLTTLSLVSRYPKARIIGYDFSKNMLDNASKRLRSYDFVPLEKNYVNVNFEKNVDIFVSVIGFHHQSNKEKLNILKKAYKSLNKGGIFLLGDLLTCQNKEKAAYNDAKHFHHLVEKASSKKALEEWAFHHKFLNNLITIEEQISLMKKAGFKAKVLFEKYNTVLISGEK
jgi:ubiquinone/menaquinone biosynthesis C-methylase UbiE